jgi:hypothetical protein
MKEPGAKRVVSIFELGNKGLDLLALEAYLQYLRLVFYELQGKYHSTSPYQLWFGF